MKQHPKKMDVNTDENDIEKCISGMICVSEISKEWIIITKSP